MDHHHLVGLHQLEEAMAVVDLLVLVVVLKDNMDLVKQVLSSVVVVATV